MLGRVAPRVRRQQHQSEMEKDGGGDALWGDARGRSAGRPPMPSRGGSIRFFCLMQLLLPLRLLLLRVGCVMEEGKRLPPPNARGEARIALDARQSSSGRLRPGDAANRAAAQLPGTLRDRTHPTLPALEL